MNRAAAHDGSSAGEGAPTERSDVGIAVINRDPVHRHAQRIGADLRHAGLMTLAQHRNAQIDGDVIAIANHDARALVRLEPSGIFHKAGDASAMIPAILKTTLKRL